MKPNQRRQIYIKGSFQRQFVMQFCGMVLAGCVLFGVILYFYVRQVMESADILLPALGATTVIVTALVALAAGTRGFRTARIPYRVRKGHVMPGNLSLWNPVP